MSYVIYHTESTLLLNPGQYASESAAKGALTKADNNDLLPNDTTKEEWAVAEKNEFHTKIEKHVTRKNLMSGKEFMEPINTPVYLSPAFESYWSM